MYDDISVGCDTDVSLFGKTFVCDFIFPMYIIRKYICLLFKGCK